MNSAPFSASSAPAVRDLVDRYRYASDRFHVEYVDPNERPDLVATLGVSEQDLVRGIMRVSLGVVIPVAAATAGISVFLVGSVLRARRRCVQTGSEGLIGAEAVARERFECVDDRFVGPVLVHGEIWNAVSNGPVARGEPVRIEDRRGLTLVVAAPDLSVDLSRPEVTA